MILFLLAPLLLLVQLAAALGIPNALTFTPSSSALTLASAAAGSALPILYDSADAEAVHIAIRTFAEDVFRVTGQKPEVFADALPDGTTAAAIIAATVGSALLKRIRKKKQVANGGDDETVLATGGDHLGSLEGKWESFDARVVSTPIDGLDEALVVAGSDRRGVIYGLYTLAESMGVSPWYWWADVPIKTHDTVAIPRDALHSHGAPSVKYRGFFFNDEQPVLWNWAREHFNMGDKPPFQVGMYEKAFELLLRLKGNYMWPAMWSSMFAVDGVDELLEKPTPGPNQALAERMGVVMGTSHHEPMSRNQKEYTTWGSGDWNYNTNSKWLNEFWKYGAERAKDCETVYTVGMRGDGDLALEGADVPLVESIAAAQQEILRKVNGRQDISDIPQMWAMYKEVMEYFANGLRVPDEVTPMLCDDNWGNLMAVLPTDKEYKSGGGIYYHADYVGDPRDYKWINTVPLAKMWEQLNVALSFKTDTVWILNVGDLKTLEIPLEYFLDIAYDAPRWPRTSLNEYLGDRAARDFGVDGDAATEVADIMAKYSMYASRRKAELVDSNTFSLINYNEAETVVADWTALEDRARKVYETLSPESQVPFYEVLYVQLQLQANLARLYLAAAKSNLFATQGRTAATVHAHEALALFERDHDLTEEYNRLLNGKWKHMLAQTHIGYQYWQMPVRNSLPPVSFVSLRQHSYDHGLIIHTRYTVENCAGAWPGDNKHNCPLGYNAPDPTLLPMDKYGRPRWVDVGSGGPEDVEFTATPDADWLVVSATKGKITGDGKNDVRVWISVDWAKVAEADKEGHVTFHASDGAHTVITVPLHHATAPPTDFTGAVEGDGYIAIEAGQHQALTPTESHSWAEIPHYGRTRSGMGVFPVDAHEFTAGSGPGVRYDFFATTTAAEPTVTLHLGPALNYVLGRRTALGVQVDDGAVVVVHPVPEAKLGSLPADWEDVVAAEVREVTVEVGTELAPGKHSVTVYGMGCGVVLERLLVDMGGMGERGYSYLGPPASVTV